MQRYAALGAITGACRGAILGAVLAPLALTALVALFPPGPPSGETPWAVSLFGVLVGAAAGGLGCGKSGAA